jgi:hypothetical protein
MGPWQNSGNIHAYNSGNNYGTFNGQFNFLSNNIFEMFSGLLDADDLDALEDLEDIELDESDDAAPDDDADDTDGFDITIDEG